MTLNRMTPIRYFSFMNDFLDFVVFVPEHQAEEAAQKIQQALDKFWDDEYETYGDAVYGELEPADIPFVMVAQPWDDMNDCPDKLVMDYEKWAEDLPGIITLHS